MSEMHSNQNSKKENNHNGDPWWSNINGIGQKRAEWLRNEFNIQSVEDFVALSINEIEIRIQQANNIRWRHDEIESSSNNAQEFVTDVSKASQLEEKTSIFRADMRVNNSSEESEWDYIAAYSVEFRMPKNEESQKGLNMFVRPIEITNNGTWVDIKGDGSVIAGKDLYQWMLKQLPINALIKSENNIHEDLQEDIDKKPAEVRVELVQVQAYQPPVANIPSAIGDRDNSFKGFIRGHQPFNLRISFDLIGPGSVNFSLNKFPYRAQVYARDLSRKKRLRLGEPIHGNLVENQTSYTTTLSKTSLMPGMYHLQALVNIIDSPPLAGIMDVPLLQVV